MKDRKKGYWFVILLGVIGFGSLVVGSPGTAAAVDTPWSQEKTGTMTLVSDDSARLSGFQFDKNFLRKFFGKHLKRIRTRLRDRRIRLDAPNWVGLIGIDYQPNHYPPGQIFNNHDVFFVGMDSTNAPVTNVYAELAQLKAAGFTTVRSYQTVPFAWIDLIKQAHALGLSVIYEAAIPQGGNQTSIDNALEVLKDVIGVVGVPTFNSTVVLVFAGHENYSNTNIAYLTSAISQLQSTLAGQGLSAVPVGTALVSGDLVTPGNPTDMQTLINASSSSAPLGFDPYPFQWGVTPADQAASNASLQNSIAWDYVQVKKQPFYSNNKAILMAETGWATEGTGQWANYFCYLHNIPCQPSVANAADYLQAVYNFVRTTSNTSSVLVFEAYDEAGKISHASGQRRKPLWYF